MIAGNREADFLVNLKTPVWGHEDDVGGFHGVFGGQNNSAVIYAPLKRGVLGTADCEMPFEQVFLQGLGVVISGRLM